MAKFIKVSTDSKNKIFVNIDKIETIVPQNFGCIINLSGENSAIQVKETASWVISEINFICKQL